MITGYDLYAGRAGQRLGAAFGAHDVVIGNAARHFNNDINGACGISATGQQHDVREPDLRGFIVSEKFLIDRG